MTRLSELEKALRKAEVGSADLDGRVEAQELLTERIEEELTSKK